uniref:Aspergillic acid non-ribosomal peptide sythetase-like (NRPS-like) (AsaC) n=1 Tax=Aspergillus sp. 'korhogoensis' TaxID=2382060 RepID=A0A3S8UVR1_9EURO|nr:aspergillic acid non-ribosomal peptide sythetase-like (NRPS-like) (AsaC) [Aspergillus sp. 'korhogoensis']
MSIFSSISSLGLEACYRHHVRTSPNATAVVDGDQSMTYRELDTRVNDLASILGRENIEEEEPIGILVPMGITHVVAQAAVLRLGGSCVPMDLSFPDQRINDLLRALKTRIVLTVESEKARFAEFQTILVDSKYANLHQNGYHEDKIPAVETGRNHRTHILHTSGTTGLPKPVEIMSKGITRMAFNTQCVEFKSTDRVAQISAPSFDAALFEIWTTLARGAAIVLLPKNVVIDPVALHDSLRKYRITSILVTTALLNHVVSAIPNAFEDLDYVLTGGEAANPSVMQVILENGPPKKLVHAYGPTECTIITTYHLTTLEEVRRGQTPIGRPLDNTTVYILDDNLQPVKEGIVGELYIGGDAVARGYLGRPEANAKSFLEVSHLSKDGSPVRIYRSGDLVRMLDTGAIEFVARADNMVKIRGFRIEPAEIEGALLKSEMVQGTVVLPVHRPGKETYIVAFVIPKHDGAFSLEQLDEYLRRRLPAYMMPRLEAVASLPLTVHGKIDRVAVMKKHMEETKRAEQQVLISSNVKDAGDSVTWLRTLWTSVLGISNIDNETSFFHLGGSSLQAAALLVHIRRRFGLTLTMQQIYDSPTLLGLASVIDAGHAKSKVDHSRLGIFIADSQLAKDIPVLSKEAPDWRSPSEGKVFLTGATGFLGTYFLRELIDRPDVRNVQCLVRASDAHSARARLLGALDKYGLGWADNLDKVTAIAGDLGKDLFGLSETEFHELALWTSVIFHVGAHVNYVQPYEKHRNTNVYGTLNCIKLATTGRTKALHYTSTAAVTGPVSHFTGADKIPEDVDLGEFQGWLPYDIGYTQSKWVSEQLIHSMIAKGLPAIVFRPGFIMGDSLRGKGNCDDFMCRVFIGSIKLGYRPILPNQSKIMIPVDFITTAMLHITSNPYNFGRTFHLVPQTPEEDTDIETSWNMLKELGYDLKAVEYKDWLEILSKDKDLLTNPLLPMLPVLQEPVRKHLTRWELYEDMATYDVTNTRRSLADRGNLKSGIGLEDLRRHVEDWVARGLVPSRN